VTWQVQTAKAKFSELLRKARDEGAQTITLRGAAAFVVLTKDAHDRLVAAAAAGEPKTGLDLFRSIYGLGIENLDELIGPRDGAGLRDVDFSSPEYDLPSDRPSRGPGVSET
jgi:prevent-host-death family protein